MIRLLDQAFQVAGSLPTDTQDELALWFLKQIKMSESGMTLSHDHQTSWRSF